MALYAGFAAFFTGITLSALGILLVVSGDTLIEGAAARNEIGIVLAAGGFPLFFLGLQLTLPSRWVIHLVAGLGAAVCGLAVVLFTQAWPTEWGPRAQLDRSPSIIATYFLGLVVLAVTTAMALVINFVSRHVLAPGIEGERDPFADPDRPVSMEEVMRDIEREVARQRLTWGGVEEERLPREYVKIKSDWTRGATIRGNRGKVTETVAKELDVAFEALARLRGTEGRHVTGDDDTATAIAALTALRRARRAEEEASWWFRFKRWLVAIFTGRPQPPAGQRDDRKKPKDEMGTPPNASRPAAAGIAPEPADPSAPAGPTRAASKPRRRAKTTGTARPARPAGKRAAKKAPRKTATRTARKSAGRATKRSGARKRPRK